MKTRHPLASLAWGLLSLSALAVGLVSLRYALPGMPFPSELPSLQLSRHAFIVHAVSASLALMLGPLQLLVALRQRYPAAHRWTGRAYVLAIAVAWLSSLPLAANAMTGVVAAVGFFALGLAWVVATGWGVACALQRRFAEHRRWMLRSYALTAAAITLRIYLGLGAAAGVDIEVSYPFIAWLCWVPNLLVAEWYLRRSGPQARLSPLGAA
ncbi:DUF2306 domain-containing protein [Acidovorax kalamii]|uniref:DUF2306 domain-containing protein n=1 Tax=Acidovorax kalamii TaxID=2004485 RepID=A0A235EIK7_9BURK|nr:DUF2306 domain-containing protein [Acidovorax kalamii]OYD48275.1 hypothetical protein CBY09_19765 [Acidovorax kalamii]